MTLPGTTMLNLARHVVDPPTVVRVLEPLVADWQREWLAAPTMTRRAVARVHGFAAFLTSSAYCLATDPVPRSVHQGTWTMMLSFTAVGTLLLTLPFIEWVSSLWMLALLLPGTLTLSIPFATLPLAMKLGATPGQGPAGARHLVRVTMAIVVLVFVMHNWGMPLGNVAFRTKAIEIANSQLRKPVPASRLPEPRRGARELTLPELMTADASTTRIMASPRQLHEERHHRATVPLIPIVLAVLGWSLTRATGPARRTRIVFWWAFASLTYGLLRSEGMTFERAWDLPREIAVWLPLVLWVSASAALISWRRRGPGDALARA
jgi:hypothetical protein